MTINGAPRVTIFFPFRPITVGEHAKNVEETAQSLIQSTRDRLGIKKKKQEKGEEVEKGDGTDLSIAASN